MRILPLLLVLLLVASCVSAPPPPPPARRVEAPPPVAALPPPAPLVSDWRDWPQTPGDWRYQRYGKRSYATFELTDPSELAISCEVDRRVRIARFRVTTAGNLTIRTSSLTRTLASDPVGHPPAGEEVSLSATDPLLDAIAFSRGRFVVEQPGQPPLVLPAWAEIGRVIEDCRT